MKVTAYLLLMFSSILIIAQPADSPEMERAQVEEALQNYMKGGTTNNFEMLSKAFHQDATMKWMTPDGYKEVNALEFFGSRMKPGPDQKRTTSIAHLDVTGSVAQAKLELRYDDFTFVDYINLLKIGGEWKIVSKIFYRVSHED